VCVQAGFPACTRSLAIFTPTFAPPPTCSDVDWPSQWVFAEAALADPALGFKLGAALAVWALEVASLGVAFEVPDIDAMLSQLLV
jgi:hypothetical protein